MKVLEFFFLICDEQHKKRKVSFLISKEYRGRFRELCQKNEIIMSVFIENAIKRFVDSR